MIDNTQIVVLVWLANVSISVKLPRRELPIDERHRLRFNYVPSSAFPTPKSRPPMSLSSGSKASHVLGLGRDTQRSLMPWADDPIGGLCAAPVRPWLRLVDGYADEEGRAERDPINRPTHKPCVTDLGTSA
jgi:hypothetical protein